MKEFVNANRADFEELDSLLNSGKTLVFHNRVLPKGCAPDLATIRFIKKDGIYKITLDSVVNVETDNIRFRRFVECGEVNLNSIDEMRGFFREIGVLFEESPKGASESVVDLEKLSTIREEDKTMKNVWPEQLAGAIKSEIYGQNIAIDTLSEGIVLNRMYSDRPYVGLLMGPPATGKTETASMISRELSKLVEEDYGFIKIDANIYGQDHMICKILGSPPGYVGFGEKTVFDPVRKNPYHVVLVDEIEKADEHLLIALMEALDTGYMQLADNSSPIDMTKCIFLFTSNIPIDIEEYLHADEWDRNEMCKDVFTSHCGRPEISRRIQDIVVYMPISEEAEVGIIVKFAKKAINSFGARLVHIDERLMLQFMDRRTMYGASEIGNRVSRAIGRAVLKKRDPNWIKDKAVAIVGTAEDIRINIITELEMGNNEENC